MNIPSFNEPEIPKEKISDYLLCLEHPEGGSKARFFLSRGFSYEDWTELAEALRQQAVTGGAARMEERPLRHKIYRGWHDFLSRWQ